MIKISIIIPVYNTEKYLRRCLNSIITQSLREIEIIVINDGSTDNSIQILNEYVAIDKRIKLINKKNEGPSSARNKGLSQIKGEYVLQIDSDDWIEINYLEDMYTKAKSENLDIIVSDIIWDWDNSKIKYVRDLELDENVFITGEEYVRKLFNGEIFPAVWNKLFRSELYKKYKITYPVGISIGEDLVVTSLLAQHSIKIGKINKGFVHYIQNPNGLTQSSPTLKVYELIKVFEILKNNLNIKVDTEMKELRSLANLILAPNYNPNDIYYEEAIKHYLKLLSKTSDLRKVGLKLRISLRILKLFPKIKTLKFLQLLNKINIYYQKIKF
ncbi:glycosyltransferase family 2 protein [Cetobacterium sp.]|uniref:glycosyltransferase family 2 protein n=1 Tax=Cetobacterium sp. TaxID=2071632 RepID=UPI003EE4631A